MVPWAELIFKKESECFIFGLSLFFYKKKKLKKSQVENT